ncbi:MAG: N-acetylmuramoyl-L-alanine amidase [Oscillospiraceae bacterium]|nr:N-acetylmuramoyl-L-alanine amidase [Oscillospiraceae bacterium]
MKKIPYQSFLPVYLFVMICFLMVAVGGSRAVTAWTASAPITGRKTVVIDAGHGGVDGGATSCTGVLESQFNLEIAIKLNDLMRFLGIQTLMIRETDCSVYTQGETISQKKISDLRERVRIVNSIKDCVLISIHQNHFSDSKYSGAQVFYPMTNGSRELSTKLQENIKSTLNPGSHRGIKKADGIYLMQHINCPGALIECGFLSNPQEEYLLRSKDYQQKMCIVIACTVSTWLWGT